MNKPKKAPDPDAERGAADLAEWTAQKRREGFRVRYVRPPRPGPQPDFRFK